jgi:hypothetical protein
MRDIQLFYREESGVSLRRSSSQQLWDSEHAKQLNSNKRARNLIGGLQQLK